MHTYELHEGYALFKCFSYWQVFSISQLLVQAQATVLLGHCFAHRICTIIYVAVVGDIQLLNSSDGTTEILVSIVLPFLNTSISYIVHLFTGEGGH